MLFDDGDVHETFPDPSNSQWHIHRLHLQLFLVIVFILDEERHVNVYRLHAFLELYRSGSLCRDGTAKSKTTEDMI